MLTICATHISQKSTIHRKWFLFLFPEILLTLTLAFRWDWHTKQVLVENKRTEAKVNQMCHFFYSFAFDLGPMTLTLKLELDMAKICVRTPKMKFFVLVVKSYVTASTDLSEITTYSHTRMVKSRNHTSTYTKQGQPPRWRQSRIWYLKWFPLNSIVPDIYER